MSVTLSGKLSPRRYWRRAWKKKPWLRLLSGATCEPSTVARGVELWIASLAATRANRSASPVSGVERMILGTFGRASLESLRRLNPHCVSSKTSAGTYLSGSTLFGTSFRDWATELRLDFSRRQKLARRTGGSGCSSWPTATSGDAKASGAAGYDTTNRNAGTTLTDATERIGMWPTASASVANDGESMESWEARKARNLAKHTNGNGMGTPLTVATMQWSTPVASDAWRSGPLTDKQTNRARGAPRQLSADVATWLTPRTSDTNGAGKHGTGGVDLRTQAGSWPTPMAQDGEDAGSVNASMVSLGRAAKDWPTPGAIDHKGSAKDGQRRGQLDEATEQRWQTPATDSFRSRGGDRKDEMGLDQQARGFPSSLLDQEPAASGSGSCEAGPTSRPRLNPKFVELLMGWPEGWTDFAPVGTGWSLWRRRMRSCLFGLVCGRAEP